MLSFVVLRLIAAMWLGITPSSEVEHKPTEPKANVYVGDTIYWHPQHRLTWNDFRGRPNRGGNTVALTSSGIGIVYRSQRSGVPIIDVQCVFYGDNSWVKSDGRTGYILQHEQLHFDITELFARELRRRIDLLPAKQRTWQNVQRLYTTVNRECDVMQTRYDGQTHHSTNEYSQEQWFDWVNENLDRSVSFASNGF